jgi:hypothetical protein
MYIGIVRTIWKQFNFGWVMFLSSSGQGSAGWKSIETWWTWYLLANLGKMAQDLVGTISTPLIPNSIPQCRQWFGSGFAIISFSLPYSQHANSGVSKQLFLEDLSIQELLSSWQLDRAVLKGFQQLRSSSRESAKSTFSKKISRMKNVVSAWISSTKTIK